MPPRKKNYYELLNLGPKAGPEEIKGAYREIARIYHPDSNYFKDIIDDQLSPQALDTFKEITAAYQVLSDPEKRAEYDRNMPAEVPDWDSPSEKHRPGPVFQSSERVKAHKYKARSFGSIEPEGETSALQEAAGPGVFSRIFSLLKRSG